MAPECVHPCGQAEPPRGDAGGAPAAGSDKKIGSASGSGAARFLKPGPGIDKKIGQHEKHEDML